MIKPEFFDSESLGKCSIEARMLFVGLWVMGDDFGRQKAQLSKIKMQVFPYDEMSTEHLLDLLCELEEVGCIRGYEVDEQRYICIPNFSCYQTVRKPSKSAIPEPPEEAVRTNASPVMHQWRTSDVPVQDQCRTDTRTCKSTSLVQHQYVTSDAKERKKEGSSCCLTTTTANEYGVADADVENSTSPPPRACSICDAPMDPIVSESGLVTYQCDLCGNTEAML